MVADNVKATNNKKSNEKALVSCKLQENQRKVQKEIKKQANRKWKSTKKLGWGGKTKRKFKECKVNEN